MKLRFFLLIPIIFMIFFYCQMLSETEWSFNNPDKTFQFTLKLQNTKLYYKIDHITANNTLLSAVEFSPLGLTRGDQDFSTNLTFHQKSPIRTLAETYNMLIGKQSTLSYTASEQCFTFKNKNGAQIEIDVRLFADGAAFRYGFSGTSNENLKIIAEATGFKIPLPGDAWLLPYSKVDTWAPAYEAEWQNKIAIGTAAPDTVGWSMPMLFNTNELWLLITEAGVDTNCYGAHLEQNADSGLYTIRLPEYDETYSVAPQEAVFNLPWKSPWRTIVIGKSLKTIVETNIVYHLSPPCAFSDLSWIKPGRVSWSWWSDPTSPYKYNKLVPFIDLSARLGWEYSLIDLGWHEMTDGGDIHKLIDYANSKNVGLILWYNSGGPHNQVPNACPCDIMHDPVKRNQEMAMLQSWGIKGIKVDFMQSEKQYVIKLYQDIIRDAAKYHLLVNFHGATFPRGWSRTYPNLMSHEGVRGAEQYWDVNFSENAHTFHTIYTYTRNVIGPMDYTPVILGDAPNKAPHKTTNAHELATSVAFESGWQHFADGATNYLAQPDYVLDFLAAVPVTWDETLYLDGKPGELTLMARRKGNDWYLACLNGENIDKTVHVNFFFLGTGKYQCNLILDGMTPRSFQQEIKAVQSKDTLAVKVSGRGGFTAGITREE
ncbi:glycoside hydrolase family 97 catalytic domain-containing protein [candidate division KSB1 bacterium]|nr:glycoside hydrolase family 97 catalytic domain-containing protein [candidate division KSB1 bacterium]